MRKMIMMLAAVLIVTVVQAQEEKTVEKIDRKELRKQKREQRKKIYEIRKAEGANLIESRDFVLKVDQISGRNAIPIIVSNDVNFIKIDGDDIVVQYGLNGRTGLNGVGGITLEGKIYEVDTWDSGEGKPYSARVNFTSPLLRQMTTLYIDLRGGKSKATMYSNGSIINFEGLYASIDSSVIAHAKTRGPF